MIDIHSHILPNFDDGSKNINQFIKMAKSAELNGFSEICCTPHYMEGVYYSNIPKTDIEKFQNILNENNVNIKLNVGNEVYICQDISGLIKQGRIKCLNNTRYILMELPMNNKIIFLDNVLFDIARNGYIPIIAHPERYSYVKENPSILKEYIEKGVILQSNYGSILGYYGKDVKKTVIKLLKMGFIHLFATDSHNTDIYENISKAKKHIEKVVGHERLEELSEIIPKSIVEDKLI